MIHLPISDHLRKALFRTLLSSHRMSVKVNIHRGGDEKRLGALDFRYGGSRVISGVVQVDTTQTISRTLDLSFIDKNHGLKFDPDSPTDAASSAGYIISVEYMVYVPHHTLFPRADLYPSPHLYPGESHQKDTGTWVKIPIFWGPITTWEEVGPEVNISASGKETLGLSPHLTTKGYTLKKHLRTDDAIKEVLDRINESHYDMVEMPWRLGEDRPVAAGAEPWRIVAGGESDTGGNKKHGLIEQTGKHPHHIFYDGKGRVRVKRLNKEPVHKFTYGGILSEPDWTFDDEALINTIIVRGQKIKSKGKGKDKDKGKGHVSATVTLPKDHKLSPHALGSPGEPVYYVRYVDAPDLQTEKDCRQRGHHLLQHHVNKSVEVSVDVLPIPMLEELDVVSVSVDGWRYEFPLKQFSIPLTSDSPMSISNNKRITKGKHHKRRGGAAGPGGKGASGGTAAPHPKSNKRNKGSGQDKKRGNQ